MSSRSKPLSRGADAAARDIQRMSDAFRKHYRSFVAHDDQPSVLAMELGWGVRLCRTSEAVVTLHRARHDSEAAPLVRSVMEHALKLRWLAARGDEALEAIEFGHRRYQRLLRESIEKGSWELTDVDDDDLPPSDLDMEQPIERAAFDNVEQLVQKYGGDPSWYATYRFESSTSHASYLSAAAYFDDSKLGTPGYGIAWEPTVPGTHLRVTSVWLLMGLGQFSEFADVPAEFAAILTDIDAQVAKENAEHEAPG